MVCSMNGGCDNNCNPTEGFKGGKGTTIWGPISFTLGPKGSQTDTKTLHFTATQPQCYQNSSPQKCSACNLSYTIRTTQDSDNPVVSLYLYLNGHTSANADPGKRYHSRLANHDLSEVIDLSQSIDGFDGSGNPVYSLNDPDLNTLEFVNDDEYVSVTIEDLTVVRIYPMCYLPCDGKNACTDGMCDGSGPCGSEQPYSKIENDPLDSTRQDYPCNYKDCGNISYTKFGPDNHVKEISPSPYVNAVWTWTNPPDPCYNYVNKKHCFFNLNNVATSGVSENDDVTFWLRLNYDPTNHPDSPWVQFYHPTGNYHIAHGVDLANHPTLSGFYDDSPNGTNTLELYYDPNADVDLVLCDGCSGSCPPYCQEGGNIDIYRTYQTEPVYLTIEASVATGGGSISPSGIVQVDYGGNKTFNITPNTGYLIYHVDVMNDGENWVSQGAISSYTFINVTNLKHKIRAYFTSCGTCQTVCQTACVVSCQETCQISCQPCETCQPCVTCQDTCQLTCQTGCEVACQLPCEFCQMTCQWTCMAACQLSCQTCNTCQTTCELSCQTGCEVSCQSGCEVSCQSPCMVCQLPCLWSCLMIQ
jgi:hypothetical protein